MSCGREVKTTCRSTVVWSEMDGVVTLTLSRPPANALDKATIEQLKAHFEALHNGGSEARCVMLTGSGTRFTSPN